MLTLPDDIQAITQMADPVLRNLFITQRYHDLSLALSAAVSGADVNWSTFASWASKTAGESIRNEEVPPFVSALVDGAGDAAPHLRAVSAALQAVSPHAGSPSAFLLATIQQTLATVSSFVAHGNLAVFAELAPQFVRFAATFGDDDAFDDAKLAAFTALLAPGPVDQGGQDLLRTAFSSYYRARFEQDPAARARLLLFGNCLVGLHEQTRLQPDIAAAINAPVTVILRDHVHAGMPQGLADGLGHAVEAALAALAPEVEKLWQRIATRFLMRLALPGGQELPLGRDIPRSAAARAFLPAALQDITSPPGLVDLLATYDRARGDTDAGSASVDWAVLADRMNFIVNLFRSSQQDLALFGEPFSAEQRAELAAGRLPAGKL